MKGIDEYNYKNKTVLLRIDINLPLDPLTKKIVSESRIKKSIPTIKALLEKGAKLVMIAHQGDTLDYDNLIPLKEHAEKINACLEKPITYIDDPCGPAAQAAIAELRAGEGILLGNLRYLTEEVSTFENAIKLKPEEMEHTYLVRSLLPLCDYYVNDAFAAAHRNAPSMVAFQRLLPTAAGPLMEKEITALDRIMEHPKAPCVFLLGGAKISDAFGMMRQVLQTKRADLILTSGITGEIMLMAKGYSLGEKKETFIKDRGLDVFLDAAKEYLEQYPEKIRVPVDLAYEKNGKRHSLPVEKLPQPEMFMDLGDESIKLYEKEIARANTIFVNGPAGVYEKLPFEEGTRRIWKAIASAKGYSVIGGGDTVSAAQKYIALQDVDYVCTAGGAMVRYLSGRELPLIKAMKSARAE
ncbi:phosphoglycerate kinase [Anaerovorax odorimutans]|uniref:Phosphoglycerate kinase n=1 Tax=Anaerovorax odorimutans TaxID=109327 RepID=A0ABT1RSM0_9FIRM|nr:phosphoglycerate kinase [Anaerovorax odorimutans]MCQ4637856.1 phosphoglycerate kinase [Anaerovorax odorimutans]